MFLVYKKSSNYIDKDYERILNINENNLYFIDSVININDSIVYYHLIDTPPEYWFSKQCFESFNLKIN